MRVEVAAGHVTIGGAGAIIVGDAVVLALSAPTAPDGTPEQLRGQSILFDLRPTDTSAASLLSKPATVDGTYSSIRSSNTERALVTLTDAETAALAGGSIYRHSWKRVDAGTARILAYGWFYPEVH